MTLRARNRERQWMAWLGAALVTLAVYVVLSRCLYDVVGWNPLEIRCHRLMLPLAVLFALVARATRWDGVVREEVGKKAKESGASPLPAPVRRRREAGLRRTASHPAVAAIPQPRPSPPSAASSPAGEDLFNEARAIPHQPIPDFQVDGAYLGLLGKSAAQGYAPALVKLGEYALRRTAWVEAYYWMTLARRNGMHGLSPTLRAIRQSWARDGFPDQAGNVSGLFPAEAGSLGRALLHLDSGHDAAAAREFLKTHHPDFL